MMVGEEREEERDRWRGRAGSLSTGGKGPRGRKTGRALAAAARLGLAQERVHAVR